jgi:hypothetical protein
MWLIPILVIGALVVAAASKSPREAAPPSRQLPPPPGPISVLGEILRIGQSPPPTVILCAIAEAEALGRGDLASDIVRAFVAPVVYQHQKARARQGHVAYERGSCALPRAPRAQADQRWSCAPQASQRGTCAPRACADQSPPAVPPPPPMPTPLAQRAPTEDEILAMLHSNPQAFLAMVSSGRPPVIDVPVEMAASAPAPSPVAAPMASPMVAAAPMPAPIEPQPTGLPPETVAQMQEAAGLPEAANRTRAMAPGSPLGGVPDGAWREFVTRLEREAPTFASSRHVGQYRQRRERLAELGINPAAIHGSANAQRAALDADLADAHGHAVAGGLLTEHVGRAITMPGRDGHETITLSGVLGVVQCAGLEGAVGWLERPNDRKRYPHTTQAFLRTNGVF